jgi:signal peptide peptidase-like protein 2B
VVPAGLALFGGDVAENETLGPWSLGVPKTDTYGCTNDGVGTTFEKDVLVVTRGECEFYQKALVAQTLGAKGLLIVSPGEDFTTMTCNEATKLDIVTALVTGATGQAIVDAIGEVTAPTITLARADALPRPFDFLASTALVAIAMLTIYLGGLWSLKDKRYAHSPRREDSAEINTSDADEGAQDGIEINEYTAFYFVIIASAVLLILFYSMQHWIFVVMRLVFAFASFQGLHVIIFESLIAYRKTAPRDSQVLLPLIGNVHFLSIPAAFRSRFDNCYLAHLPGCSLVLDLTRHHGALILGQRPSFGALAKLEGGDYSFVLRDVVRHLLGVHPTTSVWG